MSRPESGCVVCSAKDHNVQSCEHEKAVAHWRARAEQVLVGLKNASSEFRRATIKLAAEKHKRRADKLERRLRGEPLPVGQATARFPRRGT